MLCMFPFWLFWVSHGGTDDTFPCILFMPFFFLLLQNSHNVFSSTFLMLAAQQAAIWQENSLSTLDLPLCFPCLLFQSRISSASLIPSQSNPSTFDPWVTNFFFEFSFFLNWPLSKRDWPYCFMFQIHQLSTPCNPQLLSDPLSEKKKKVNFEKEGSYFLVTTLC